MGWSKHFASRQLCSAVNPGQLIKPHHGLEEIFLCTVHLHLFHSMLSKKPPDLLYFEVVNKPTIFQSLQRISPHAPFVTHSQKWLTFIESLLCTKSITDIISSKHQKRELGGGTLTLLLFSLIGRQDQFSTPAKRMSFIIALREKFQVSLWMAHLESCAHPWANHSGHSNRIEWPGLGQTITSSP